MLCDVDVKLVKYDWVDLVFEVKINLNLEERYVIEDLNVFNLFCLM